jgi:two-component system cell cycle sensor histidine kinase/response regulator CckA
MAQSHDTAAKTILVIEQNPLLLKLVKLILANAGFEVLTADSAKSAILIEVGFSRPIHLLLSALTLSGTTGPDLAKRMKERRPELLVLFMSGYPDGALLILNYGWQFIAKPFVAGELVRKVSDVLISTTPAQGTHGFDTRL